MRVDRDKKLDAVFFLEEIDGGEFDKEFLDTHNDAIQGLRQTSGQSLVAWIFFG